MGLRHVVGDRCISSLGMGPDMRGHPLVAEKSLYNGSCQPYIQIFVAELIRYAVVVVINFDVVIDPGPFFYFPFRVLIGKSG